MTLFLLTSPWATAARVFVPGSFYTWFCTIAHGCGCASKKVLYSSSLSLFRLCAKRGTGDCQDDDCLFAAAISASSTWKLHHRISVVSPLISRWEKAKERKHKFQIAAPMQKSTPRPVKNFTKWKMAKFNFLERFELWSFTGSLFFVINAKLDMLLDDLWSDSMTKNLNFDYSKLFLVFDLKSHCSTCILHTL